MTVSGTRRRSWGSASWLWLVLFVCPPVGAIDLEEERWSIAHPRLQEDFPSVCVDLQGTAWVVYVQYDGQADRLKLARRTEDGLIPIGDLSAAGVVHQPAVACDGKGVVWAIWSELTARNRWRLMARSVIDGRIAGEPVVLESASGSAVFADAGTDRRGRLWVAWQSFRASAADIYAKMYDPATAKWTPDIRVTRHRAGDWEPRLAFGNGDEAWIVFDSSRDGSFGIYLATVATDGASAVTAVRNTPRYEGRVSVEASRDGRGFWVASERGRAEWGHDSRGVDGKAGLNWGKSIDLGFFDVATETYTPASDPTPLLRHGPGALNLPTVAVDNAGNPWLAYRFYQKTHWRLAVSRYNPAGKSWTRPVVLSDSGFGQDRRCAWARHQDGKMWLVWPSDQRTSKAALASGVYLARIAPGTAEQLTEIRTPTAKPTIRKPNRPQRWGQHTPERSRDDRHTWSVGDRKYGLYWGDFHRHTDVSNCRTGDDGCIVEQFRYAYDIGKLDFLGTSDHTDVGKIYTPYEWWCNQKLADVFQSPGFFKSFYVYEREQRWPWGHRNVVFIERGAPIIYIKRATYRRSPWQAKLPAGNGGAEILPDELWELLKKSGMDVSVISHTGATGMGTNWDHYDHIDHAVENLVEIYQGARISYEGLDAPQPQVGFPKGVKLKGDQHGSVKTRKDFGRYNKGVYQNALRNGHELGIFTSSDHISTHVSFGGVYTEDFSRKGILDAMNARRTIAATDKIFVEFSCNGHPMGSKFELVVKPELQVRVDGTAALRRVTIVRNEHDYKSFDVTTKDFATNFVDPAPIDGENRYYVRVQQQDGNMAWASPVWVTVNPVRAEPSPATR